MEEKELNKVNELDSANVTETDSKRKKKKKNRVFSIVFNIITIIIFLLILFQVIIGVVNMQKINNKEKPVWYLSTNTKETELKTVTEYNLGLYRIVKTDTKKETKVTLKPFFIRD